MLGRICVRSASRLASSKRSFATEAVVARYKEHGRPENVLQLEKQTLPSAGKNQVLVKMLMAPINPSDINMIEGTYPILPTLPATGGNEGLAQVVEVGSDVKGIKINDLVLPSKPGLGTWTSHALLSETDLIKLPDSAASVKPEYLASLSVNPATALRLLDDFVELKSGDVIIQNAANSMVGLSVMQIAHSRGIKTINIIRNRPGSQQLIEQMKQYGGYIVVTEDFLNTPEFKRLISDLPKPKLALNGAGGPTVAEMARILGENGTIVTYGAMSRKPVTLPASPFLFKNISLKGFWLSKWIQQHSQAERTAMYSQLVDLINAGKLRMWLERHDLSKISEAVRRAQEPMRDRKVVLVLDK
eukprot:TRINITY_DN39_c1_g1_i1.p1 TRINITY_DN39_c1_g1~~TRINITY_DN39_c1_g1_i1.p1  ORF type:complete len:359 (-),score=92.15 TRINITY_DN39_c1_g1_i1:105-1181(-)